MQSVYSALPAVEFLLGEQDIKKDAVYRRASFLVTCNTDSGKTVAYNTLTGEIALLSEDEKRLLNAETVMPCEESETLIRRRFLVPLDCDEEKIADGVQLFIRSALKANGYRNFTVFPTMACNARCFYCYEVGAKRASMDMLTAKKTAEFIISSSKGAKVNIIWYGGEPLMNMAAIDAVSNELAASGVEYSSVLATNGTLLGGDALKKAKELWHVEKAQITLDGGKDAYDKIKAYTDRESGFSDALSAVDRMLLAGIKVNIRLNTDVHNIDEMCGLCDTLAEKFAHRKGLNVYFAMLFDCDGAKRPISEADERLEVAKKVIALEDRCFLLGIAKPRKLKNTPLVSFCQADSEDSMVITAEGKLVKCDFFTDERFVGDVFSGVDSEKLEIERAAFSKHIKCKGCSMYPICGRPEGCPTGGCDDARRYIEKERIVRSLRYAVREEKNDI